MGFLIQARQVNRMLDLQVQLATRARLLRLASKPLAMDSTCFEQRHRSAHYDRRCPSDAFGVVVVAVGRITNNRPQK